MSRPTGTAKPRKLRVAIVCDYREERWFSMDLVADMLLAGLANDFAGDIEPVCVRPSFRRRATRFGPLRNSRLAINADRFLNRYFDYPRFLRENQLGADIYHLVDHSYAHLVRELPTGRTIVTCHDIDAFRAAIDGSRGWRRGLARHLLAGLRGASRITCDSDVTRNDLLTHRLSDSDRLAVVPNGVDDVLFAESDPEGDARLVSKIGPATGIELLHVGSTIPRKNIEFLIRVVAALRARNTHIRLLRAGGELTVPQRALARDLGVLDIIHTLPPLERRDIAALYRRASVTLFPSLQEGFGLPVVESLAAGTPAVVSDIPVLREVGGSVARYASPHDVSGWVSSIEALIATKGERPTAEQMKSWARRFSWRAYTEHMVNLYRETMSMASVVAEPG